jgi:hypothetical protein
LLKLALATKGGGYRAPSPNEIVATQPYIKFKHKYVYNVYLGIGVSAFSSSMHESLMMNDTSKTASIKICDELDSAAFVSMSQTIESIAIYVSLDSAGCI